MREEVEVDLRAPSPMIISPTALTNAIRRDKSPEGRFQETIGAPAVGRGRSNESSKYTIPFVETVEGGIDFQTEDPADEESFEACKAPLMRRPNNCAEVKDVAFEVKEVAMSEPVRKTVKVQYVMPAQEKTKQVVEKAKVKAKQAGQKAAEMKPDEEQVRGCFRETRATGDKVARYGNLLYDMFVQECQPNAVRGDERGHDSMFFRYGSPSSRASPESSKNRPFSPMSSESLTSDDNAFRSPKSMRYPQAAKIENPVERSERKKKNRERNSPVGRDSSVETREDTPDASDNDSLDDDNVMNKGDDQASLREIRLHMYKAGDSEEHVPRARLSRALGELAHQDKTIDSLQEKLEDTKLLLQEKENRLADAETLCRKHERKIQQLMEKTSEETRALETKIAREAQAKGKLQSRVDVLQKEIFRLKATLAEATDTAVRSVASKSAIKRAGSEESGTDGGVWEGILSEDEDNTAAEVSLRANIVTLKSQLADTQAENTPESRSSCRNSKASATSRGAMYVSPDSADEISNLRERLESAEAELAALRGSKQHNRALDEKVAMLEQTLLAAEDELRKSTEQLELASEREASLLKELQDAKDRITELEKERAANNIDSLEAVEDLKLLYANDKKESEVAMNQAQSELKQSREEVDELKAEVKRLTETIHEMSQNSVVLTEERLKERDRLEEALHRCKNTEHQLRDQILVLEDQLEKAQASSLQLVNVSENVDDSRSVKRKLDESFDSETEAIVTRESFQVEERNELKEKLRMSQAAEAKLRSEMALTRELLHCAEKVVVEMESEMKEESRQRASDESRVANELNELRKKLEASEQKNREIIAAHAKEAEAYSKNDDVLRQTEAKQQVLLNQIHVLKVALESVEIERRQEKMEVIEERRIHEDLETRRIKEIDNLRVELANVRSKVEKSNELEAEVEKLRVRLAHAQAESEEMKKTATRESQKKDEVSKKLRMEVSVVKQRLASIRQRNATRRQREERKKYELRNAGSSSTDDLSTSGESVQSFGFSAPDFSSPERPSGTFSSTSGSLSTLTGASLPKSPWSSPQKPLGSFPSPPRKRVDVSGLRQRLAESNQRLHDADTRLSGLAESSENMAQEQTRAEELSDDLMTLVAEHSDYSDSPKASPERAFHKIVQPRLVGTNKRQGTTWPGCEEGSI